jgi:hypothetical protein
MCDFLLSEVAQATLAAGGLAIGAQWERSQQETGEIGAEIAITRPVREDLFGTRPKAFDKILHLPTVLTLPGGLDQAV